MYRYSPTELVSCHSETLIYTFSALAHRRQTHFYKINFEVLFFWLESEEECEGNIHKIMNVPLSLSKLFGSCNKQL